MPESPIEVIRRLGPTSEYFKILPGLGEEEIEKAQAKHGSAFPEPLKALLRECAGLEGEYQSITWDSTGDDIELFPGSIRLMDDGAGNYWAIDTVLDPNRLGPVFFVCHDPAVIVYEARDLAGFLELYLNSKDLSSTDGEIWSKGAAGGTREGEWLVWDLSAEKVGSGAPICIYHDDIQGLQRVGNSLTFRIKHRERTGWQRFRDNWR